MRSKQTEFVKFPHLRLDWPINWHKQRLFIVWDSYVWVSIKNNNFRLCKVTTMSLVALDCLVHLHVISLLHRNKYNIYINFDADAIKSIVDIETECKKFYQLFVDQVPDFQWGQEYPTENARLHGDFAFVPKSQHQYCRKWQYGLIETCTYLQNKLRTIANSTSASAKGVSDL